MMANPKLQIDRCCPSTLGHPLNLISEDMNMRVLLKCLFTLLLTFGTFAVAEDCELLRTSQHLVITEDRWDETVSQAWSAVFHSLNLDQNAIVIEVAPGDRAKIGLGLKDIGFRGTLYIVEPNQASLQRLVQKYQRLLPSATLHPLPMPLSNARGLLPSGADLLVSNHPLDDMVLYATSDEKTRQNLFDDSESTESAETVHQAWGKLAQQPSLLEEAKAKVVEDWSDLVRTLQPRSLAISQYESGFFQQRGLRIPDETAYEILRTLKGIFGPTDPLLEQKLKRHRFSSKRWLVSKFSDEFDTQERPAIGDRMGAKILVPNRATPIKIPQPAIYQLRPSPLAALKIGEDPLEGEVTVWVDLQQDPMNVAMEGNTGSGRAAYVGRHRNIKGLGRTTEAKSRSQQHSDGDFGFLAAIWELLGSNMAYTNFKTSSSPVTAIYDRGNHPAAYGMAIVERQDEIGSLDRPTHLFQSGQPVSGQRLLRIAQKFGEQDAEKFLERFVHGAWSAGNISLDGHMLDFETSAALTGRAPHYTLTGFWIGNQFGTEYLGQIQILHALAAHPLNIDKMSPEELEIELLRARKAALTDRFADYTGLPMDRIHLFNAQHMRELERLVTRFEELSHLMYPNFAALRAGSDSGDSVSVFDLSRFLRFFPIWKAQGFSYQDMLAQIAFPPRFKESPSSYVAASVQQMFEAMGWIVRTPAQLEARSQEALEFIRDYDLLLESELSTPEMLKQAAAIAYRVNENRTYFHRVKGLDTLEALWLAFINKRISQQRFARILELLQQANDRLPFDEGDDFLDVDLRIYKEGWTAHRLKQNGFFQDVVGTFNDDGTETVQVVGPARSLLRINPATIESERPLLADSWAGFGEARPLVQASRTWLQRWATWLGY